MSGEPRWPVVAGSVLGAACTAVGVAALFHDAHDTHPLVTARWVVGLALAHDLVLVPVVLVVGVGLRRVVPGPGRALAAGGLLVSGTLALVAWPLVRGYGRSPGNPSILPRDYGRGLLVALVSTWAVVLVLHFLRRIRPRPGGTP